jgi:hypothetical protein
MERDEEDREAGMVVKVKVIGEGKRHFIVGRRKKSIILLECFQDSSSRLYGEGNGRVKALPWIEVLACDGAATAFRLSKALSTFGNIISWFWHRIGLILINLNCEG